MRRTRSSDLAHDDRRTAWRRHPLGHTATLNRRPPSPAPSCSSPFEPCRLGLDHTVPVCAAGLCCWVSRAPADAGAGGRRLTPPCGDLRPPQPVGGAGRLPSEYAVQSQGCVEHRAQSDRCGSAHGTVRGSPRSSPERTQRVTDSDHGRPSDRDGPPAEPRASTNPETIAVGISAVASHSQARRRHDQQ
jgi:hypothetical protein